MVHFLKLNIAQEFVPHKPVNSFFRFHGSGTYVIHLRDTLLLVPRYNSRMSPNAQKLLDEARQLSPDEREWLAECLLIQSNEEAFSALEKDYGEPDPGHDEWVRKGIEEALADTSGDVPHEEAMTQFHNAILRSRGLKATA